MRSSYKTRQKDALKEYLLSQQGTHITIAQIADYFQMMDIPVSTTTIYRHLEQLVAAGEAKKYNLGRSSETCYQYTGTENTQAHYHFKCSSCGKLLHIKCTSLDHMAQHLLENHNFKTDISNTIFIGTCEHCQ